MQCAVFLWHGNLVWRAHLLPSGGPHIHQNAADGCGADIPLPLTHAESVRQHSTPGLPCGPAIRRVCSANHILELHGTKGGGVFELHPPPPSPSRPPPKFLNPSFSNLRFWEKGSEAAESPPPHPFLRGYIFFTLCVYTRNTQDFVENPTLAADRPTHLPPPPPLQTPKSFRTWLGSRI